MRDVCDFATWYTPGVAEPCKEIENDPSLAYLYTNKWNMVAVVTDGTRVLGLGDIGPLASLPVMEGKPLIFKHLGGIGRGSYLSGHERRGRNRPHSGIVVPFFRGNQSRRYIPA
ncbi:MAG: hypothetical protein QW520_05440 [Methanomassiliicoccales archaeon]